MNKIGLRVDFEQKEGLFRKITSRSGILGSSPLDLDPSAPGEGVPDLISVVRLGSGGPGRLGAVRRRGLAGTEVPRRRVGKSSPDLAKTATPGSIRPELGSGSFVTPCVIHLTRHLGTAGPGARKRLRRWLWAPETRRRRVLRGSGARVLLQKGQGVCARCGQTGSGVVRCCGVL